MNIGPVGAELFHANIPTHNETRRSY